MNTRDRLGLHTANGASVESAEIMRLEARKPPTGFCRCVLAMAVAGLIVLLVAGCRSGPTRLDRAYGTSYHFATRSQILNPEAAATRVWREEFDGNIAKKSLDRYRSTFEQPPPPPSFAISVGGIK